MTPPSLNRPRRHAMNVPMTTPIRYSMTTAPPNKKRVRGRAAEITSPTGFPSTKESPKSKVNMFQTNLPIRTKYGSLIPNVSLRCANLARSKVGSDRNRSIGVPGIKSKRTKIITVTTSRVMTP